jgi:hypothetical protein
VQDHRRETERDGRFARRPRARSYATLDRFEARTGDEPALQ